MDLGWEDLMTLREEGDHEFLIELLRGHEDPVVRRRVAMVLGRLKTPGTIEPLIDAMKDVDREVARQAARSLKLMGSDAVAPLLEALDDEDVKEATRGEVAHTLGEIGDDDAVEPLIDTLDGEDRVVRMKAARALGNLGDERAVGPLVRKLSDDGKYVQRSAAWALALIGEAAVPGLVDVLGSGGPIQRGEAAWALGLIGDPEAVGPLLEALEDKVARVRFEAAGALGMIGDPRALDGLVGGLEDDGDRVRAACTMALAMLDVGKDRVERHIKDMMEDPDGMVREAAREALEELITDRMS